MNIILWYIDFFATYYVTLSMISYFAYMMTGRRMPYRRVLLLQIPAALFFGLLYCTVMYLNEFASSLIGIQYYKLFYMSVEVVLQILWLFYLFRDMNVNKRFFYASAAFPFSFITNSLIILLAVTVREALPIDDSTTKQFILGPIIAITSILLVFFSIVAIIKLTAKTNFWHKLQAFGDYPRLYIPIGAIYFICYVIIGAFGTSMTTVPWIVLIESLVYLALLGIIILLVSDLKKTERLNSIHSLLLQQSSYIQKLETIQREIRSIQHDYKNMLAGLYAQASEGNAEAVREYIETKLLKVDETVRDDLHQMNQLTRIEIPEMKGLVMTKMLEAERDRVPFRVEAMFPVKQALMETEDLLRCVGILLDNAIEEARAQIDAGNSGNIVVTLLLLQEEARLTIVVKNPVRDKPDLTRIRNEGYSTKGSGRGVGLSNYQQIVRKYPYATQETKIEGEHFIQILTLAGKTSRPPKKDEN